MPKARSALGKTHGAVENVNVDVVFAESRAGRLSAKTFFLKKVLVESLQGWLSAKESSRQALGKALLCREAAWQALGKVV